jgi:hypothetical protein
VDTIKFQVALRELSQGRIPPNIDEVVGYAEATVYEMRQARKGGAPQWVGPSAELIPGDKEG